MKWISVKDRPVPPYLWVLMYPHETLPAIRRGFWHMDAGKYMSDSLNIWEGTPTHWMPLPEPPESEE